MNSHAEFPIKI